MVRDNLPAHGTLITANEQYEGRGQRSNAWISQPGKNLTCTYILRPAHLAASRQFLLNMAVSLAVVNIAKMRLKIPSSVSIKWPNDILVKKRKIAGILIENMLQGSMIEVSLTGIGLNVNQHDFPKQLNATSFFQETGMELDMEEVISDLSNELKLQFSDLESGREAELAVRYNQHLFGKGETRLMRLDGRTMPAKVLGTDESGELRLLIEHGQVVSYPHHCIDWLL